MPPDSRFRPGSAFPRFQYGGAAGWRFHRRQQARLEPRITRSRFAELLLETLSGLRHRRADVLIDLLPEPSPSPPSEESRRDCIENIERSEN